VLVMASALALIARRFLPEHHLNGDSKDVVKAGMGLIATLSALVLGLLIASLTTSTSLIRRRARAS
jgi:hypothetical protein